MVRKFIGISAALICFCAVAANPALAQNSFKQTNLVSNMSGLAANTDQNLINPWGIAFFPGNPPSPFWISDNNAGVSTLYDNTGSQMGTFTIPPPKGSTAVAAPTGIVANGTNDFQVTAMGMAGPSLFIFSTEDGTISGWNGNGQAAILAVDNSMGGSGAVYKGLALITNSAGNNFLLASNFRSGNVDIFDKNFATGNFPGPGNFSDPSIPAGFAPFGIHVIGNNVYITYAMQDAAKHDPVNAPGNGFVNVFDMNGNLTTPNHLLSNGPLNSPWGVVQAPASFGGFNNALLVGNFGDGLITAFPIGGGQMIGQLMDQNGQLFRNLSLWDMTFSGGSDGNPNTLFFDAGLADEGAGLFGTLEAAAVQATSDFMLSPSGSSSATVTAGQAASYMVTVADFAGFNSMVSLSCSALPANSSCMFSNSSANPGTTVTVKVNTQSATAAAVMGSSVGSSGSGSSGSGSGGMGGSGGIGSGGMGMARGMTVILPQLSLLGFGLVGLVVALPRKTRRYIKKAGGATLLGGMGLILAVTLMLAASGCGGNGMNHNMQNPTPQGTFTIFVNGISGQHFHSQPLTLTVN